MDLIDRLERWASTPLFRLGNSQLSLGSLILLVLLAGLLLFLMRQINRWLREIVLVRLGVERGSREAIATISSYLLTAFILLIALQAIGLDLSSFTVLAGVLGLGLSLGLQKLSASFFSGITLLLEQPIKVGDLVSLDGVLGTVEKISFRSTSVCTLDQVHVIVPNDRLVDSNIINWSYQGTASRVHLPISVAYGTDPLWLMDALLTVARQDSRVLSQPAPTVWFRSFGDSALNFELLFWTDRPELIEPIKSDLNFRIASEFQQRNIQIPFPQMVIHRPQNATVAELPSDYLPSLLRRVDLFRDYDDSQIRLLIEKGYRRACHAGEILCREGEAGEEFYLILHGRFSVQVQRQEEAIAILESGNFFGELAVMLDIPRTATVVAIEPSVLFVVDRNNLRHLLERCPNLAEAMAEQLAQRKQVLTRAGLLAPTSNQSRPDQLRSVLRRVLRL
ncbi:mechanosensitive ion channel domain-containing protein [Synechococcus elongatus]|uniref:Mechanosensitive ion channel domain-containing protein n=1 Tax=Synechococcus elongatus PCC 11801 TaxID=2219813 RepID=A0AAN1QQ80_SYNEL|nr:mechanosensitive ion channel domain-containing protein [Synechococcus elongatus]AZB73503.1 cyclic nucleotide-binding protein [Synechococcus elongatus PCC 11801]